MGSNERNPARIYIERRALQRHMAVVNAALTYFTLTGTDRFLHDPSGYLNNRAPIDLLIEDDPEPVMELLRYMGV